MNTVKYIIFDLDGVIFDGAPLHKNAFVETLSRYYVSIEQYDNTFHEDDSKSLSSKQKIDMINKCYDMEIPFEEFYKDKNRLFFQMIERMDTIYDASKYDMIYDLYRENYVLGIATNCSPESTIQILARMDIVHYFTSISSGYEVDSPKPSSDVIYKCYRDFGIDGDHKEQSRSVYFDDTEKGACAGHDTRSKVVLTSDMSVDQITYDYVKSQIRDIEQ